MSKLLGSVSFHDNVLHGVSVFDEDYVCELNLDINHIQEWHCDQSPPEFVIAPAMLTFKQIRALSISLTKPEMTINSYMGVIRAITCAGNAYGTYTFEIELSRGDSIKLEAAEIRLNAYGQSIRTRNQFLSATERVALKDLRHAR